MRTLMAKTTTTSVTRPLRVLVPLIQQDLKNGRQAGLPFYQAAGEKMLEAKAQIKHGEFRAWIERQFQITYQHAQHYMQLARSANGRKDYTESFTSLSDFIRKETGREDYNLSDTVRPTAWHEPVKQIVSRVDTETLNLKREEMNRADERDAQRKLALQLIDIGYKVLARELHPDKGGSRDAMIRLNAVRDRLKLHA